MKPAFFLAATCCSGASPSPADQLCQPGDRGLPLVVS